MKIFVTCCMLVCAAGAIGAGPARPQPAGGPDSTTLLIYADTRARFSLGEGLEVLRLQLRRMATHLESVAVSNATPEKLAAADYVVVFCPQARPSLPTNFLHALTNRHRPLLWVGYGANELEDLPPFQGDFIFSKLYPEKHASNIVYRSKTWNVPVYPWIPARLASNSTSRVLMTVQDQGQARPLAWQLSNFMFVATVPLWGTVSHLFSDLLLDFFQVKEVPDSRLFLRLEDYHAHSNHGEFQRATDYLHARKIPYMVAVTPVWRDPEFGMIENLDANPEFVTGLRYAQQRGGRLVMKGCTYDGSKLEFWDTRLDRPMQGEEGEEYRRRIHESVRLMLKHGLFPLAWETPASAASRSAYTAIAEVFSTGVERLQLSDTTSRETYVTSAPTLDRHGRLIIPENGGYALMTSSNAFESIRENLDVITALRGTVAGCYIHCYQPLAKITALVDLLESYKLSFLDLADLNNTVQLPGSVLLSGDARLTIELQDVDVQSRSFDRSGNQLAHEREAQRYTGRRTFGRARGDYQLIEFGASRP
jgi:uncharacterized protein YdaL